MRRIIRVTESCSGCFEPGEYGGMARFYPYDEKANCYVGAGCHECGYTGKRRYSYDLTHLEQYDQEKT